jgi:hypothetical protein
MRTMDRRDVKAERLTRLEPDYEQATESAVFTAECGFFSAARLRSLLTLPFPVRIEGPDRLVRSSNDD